MEEQIMGVNTEDRKTEEQIVTEENKPTEPDIGAEKKGISGCTLKIVAVISMLIDHTGACVLGRYINAGMEAAGVGTGENMEAFTLWQKSNAALLITYNIMRSIGRLAFPIYCFLLIEGFYKTRNVKKYALRLLIFAFISEIPFDLAFNNKILEFTYQNVFFTLFFGLLAIAALDCIKNKITNKFLLKAACIGAFVILMGAAELLRTDYGAIGVAMIVILYAFYNRRAARVVAGSIAFLWELPASLAFIFIWFYNGRRGKQIKYFFYAFYPVHLLVLYFVSYMLGMTASGGF